MCLYNIHVHDVTFGTAKLKHDVFIVMFSNVQQLESFVNHYNIQLLNVRRGYLSIGHDCFPMSIPCQTSHNSLINEIWFAQRLLSYDTRYCKSKKKTLTIT